MSSSSQDIPTQVIADDDYPPDDEEEDVADDMSDDQSKPWARLTSLSKNIEPIDLLPIPVDENGRYNVYTLGRSKKCSYQYQDKDLRISNNHCTIFCRVNEALDKSLKIADRLEVWIEDTSANGTYVNRDGTRLSKGVARIIRHGDVVHLVNPMLGKASDGTLSEECTKNSFMLMMLTLSTSDRSPSKLHPILAVKGNRSIVCTFLAQ